MNYSVLYWEAREIDIERERACEKWNKTHMQNNERNLTNEQINKLK